jgi:tRNA(Arg) A34 adenosine deaminase TadA
VAELDHEHFMRRAIGLAANVPRLPFGAVIVDRDTQAIVAQSNLARRDRRHQRFGATRPRLRRPETRTLHDGRALPDVSKCHSVERH